MEDFDDMLLVRGDQFLDVNGKIFNVGSSSNNLYNNNANTMGPIENLCWRKVGTDADAMTREEYVPHPNMRLHLHDRPKSFLKMCKIIKEEVKKSTIVVAKMSLLEAIVASHYAVKYKKTLVLESASHAFAALWHHGGSPKYKLAAIPLDFIVKHYHRKAQYIMYVSQQFMQEKYPSKAVKTGCADVVLPEADESLLERRIQKIETKADGEEIVLGLVGATQAEYRGHDRLIAACGILRNKGYNITIKFLGGGTADEKRRKCARKWNVEDNVVFCGRLNHEDTMRWFDEVDVLVMPTIVESLGRAVLEAMSRGCPVIGTKETALREIVPEDCLVNCNDVQRIAEIVEKMIADKQYMISVARTNFEFAKRFTSDKINAKRKEFYDYIRKVEKE